MSQQYTIARVVNLFLSIGVSHQKYKQQTTSHYPMGMDTVAVRFMVGFRRIRGIKAPAVNLSPEAGVSPQQDKQKIIARYLMVTDMEAALFTTG